jgi:leader peptidase (prepilin peptidase)/N-methyltransferase
MSVVLEVFAALAGLAIGSFLTVVVDRVPRGASINHPGSACGNCGLRLTPRDLVPVVSWLVLRGRCRRCRTSIGAEALALEVVTAGLFLAIAFRFGQHWQTVAYCVLAGGLVGLSTIDLHTKRLPREITYVTFAVGAPFLVLAALVDHRPHRLVTALAGAAIALAFMWLLYLVSRGGMGDGDVRLSPLLGAFLGWLGLPYVPVGLFLGFLIGSIVGVGAIALGKAGRRTAIPFGPFLAAGTLLAVFVGQPIIDRLWPR